MLRGNKLDGFIYSDYLPEELGRVYVEVEEEVVVDFQNNVKSLMLKFEGNVLSEDAYNGEVENLKRGIVNVVRSNLEGGVSDEGSV